MSEGAEQIHTPEELEPRCPQCKAKLHNFVLCTRCGQGLTPEETDVASRASLMARFERERRSVQPFEIRYWYERPNGAAGPPSHWAVAGYASSRHAACTIADALHQQRAWRVEVWALDPLPKHLGSRQRYDRFPETTP